MVFENGKSYEHSTGKHMRIIGELETYAYGLALIGEDDEGNLFPVGKKEENTIGWKEN